MSRRRTDYGWYGVFALLAVAGFATVYFLSGTDAFGAAGLIVWRVFAVLFDVIVRVMSSFSAMLARGVGFRRLSRTLTAVAGIGIGYAGSLLFSDEKVAKAQGWRDKLRLTIKRVAEGWRRLPLVSKLAIAGLMIAIQLWLHWVLIVFPIGFLVPVVRRAWVQIADTAFGAWYWLKFGPLHRRFSVAVRRLPVIRHIIGGVRLTRLRYLTAWRLWRHDPRYRNEATGRRRIDFIEPLRLWRRSELDIYIARPLLGGNPRCDRPLEP